MDTIFAPINSILKASVITIRISGCKALEFYNIFSIKNNITPRYSTLCALTHNSKLIDKALVVYYKAPNSFTGEDIIEVSLHGSLSIYKQVIEILTNIDGYRFAEAGEFTKRAFLNNKLDLLQAEAVNDLVNANTVKQSDKALEQLEGKNSNYFIKLREKLIEVRAYIEAFIDFPDEEIPISKLAEINNIVKSIKKDFINLIKNFKKEKAIIHGIQISIIGPVNAGKSSLINYLAGKDVSIVSNIAGTTRDVIEVNLDLSGYLVTLIDTAGIRVKSKDEIEKIGIEKTKEKANNSDLKIILLSADQLDEHENYKEYIDENSLLVINKSDLSSNCSLTNALTISVKHQKNLDLLLNRLQSLIELQYNSDNNVSINKERHYIIINEIIAELNKVDLNGDLIFTAEILRRCTDLLGKITGIIDIEDVLDKIFTSFCIGK
ncbi:MAG: tRNA uridine-5-carboxymethylaminomethyl(34) synthesis GTPase MnmE [Alphaproteobacteria bacterium]|nr:tRNA uridine-5-carboxymethylaminomethyl(34) synthesis GTPase MnmE [Alphaproteobacteria bacterium]